MCGINGFNWAQRPLIEKMNESIKHRGPDGRGVFIDRNVSLGHVRLSIRDLSERGQQPMTNEDESVWITYNGEIYNSEALKKMLGSKVYTFKSNTDTEVVLHCYEENGINFLNSLNGIFAFCIYDKNKELLYLVRDKLGIKPLYYYYDNKKLIFSSEIKAFYAFKDLSFSLDKISILEYNLTSNIFSESFYEDIKALEPGYYLKMDLKNNKIHKEKYFGVFSVVSKVRYWGNRK